MTPNETRPGNKIARNRPRPKSTYTTIRDFTDAETGVTVRLQRSNDYPRPRYSFQIGRLQENGTAPGLEARLVPFLNVRVQTHLGKIQSMTAYSGRIESLLAQAEEYVHNEAQLTEDQILDSQIAKDEKYANRGKQQAKVTGKTQRERNKRRGGGTGA